MTRLTRNLLLSAAATGIFTLLAFGSTPSEEDLARMEAEKEARRAEMDAWTANLAKAHGSLSALSGADVLKKVSCDGGAMKSEVDAAFASTSSSARFDGVRVVYLPFLARFAEETPAAYERDLGDFAWITDSGFGNQFADHASQRTSYDLNEAAKRVVNSFKRERYLAVVVPHPGLESTMPKDGGESFDGGILVALVAMVDTSDGSTVCQAPIQVESSDTVEWQEGGRGLSAVNNETFEQALTADFEDNFEKAITGVVPSELGIKTNYGHVFR